MLGRGLLAFPYNPAAAAQTNQRLLSVLTDAQRRTLRQWVGEPYRSAGWEGLWEAQGKKKS